MYLLQIILLLMFKRAIMKNLIVSVMLSVLFTGAVASQGIYLRAGGGYGLPVATSSIGEKYLRTQLYNGNTTTNDNSLKSVTGSYGSGIDFSFALGYKFNENFIFELNTQYLVSNKIKTYDNYIYTDISNPLNSYVDNYTTSDYARGLFFNPSFVFSAGFGKAAPYGRFGLILGTPKVTEDDLYYYDGDGIDSTATSREYTKGLAFGFQGAVGMNWKISEKLDFYTELNFINLSYYAGESNVTKSIRSNGSTVYDNLPDMPLNQIQTIYKKQYDPAASTVQTDPSVALREGMPFSSVSLQVGIRFSLFTFAE
jgi:hypothetical protein